jgi:hypothetical protein
MLDYDESGRIAALRELPPHLRVVWALLCAERALTQYRKFYDRTKRGDAFVAECLAERLWGDLGGDPLSPLECEASAARLHDLVPREDLPEEAALHALACAFRARSRGGDPLDAACAGGHVLDLADYLAQQALGFGQPGIWTHAHEARVRAHPLVQHELARQARDLRELAELDDDVRDALERMKARSASEAADLLD